MTSRSKDRPRAAGDTRYRRYVQHVQEEVVPGAWACACGLLLGDVYEALYHLARTQWDVPRETE